MHFISYPFHWDIVCGGYASINFIVWSRLAVCNQNVAIHIQSDHVGRQQSHFSFESAIYHDDKPKPIWWCEAWLCVKKKAIHGGCGICSHLLLQNLNKLFLKVCREIWWGVINGSNFPFSTSIQLELFTGWVFFRSLK